MEKLRRNKNVFLSSQVTVLLKSRWQRVDTAKAEMTTLTGSRPVPGRNPRRTHGCPQVRTRLWSLIKMPFVNISNICSIFFYFSVCNVETSHLTRGLGLLGLSHDQRQKDYYYKYKRTDF